MRSVSGPLMRSTAIAEVPVGVASAAIVSVKSGMPAQAMLHLDEGKTNCVQRAPQATPRHNDSRNAPVGLTTLVSTRFDRDLTHPAALPDLVARIHHHLIPFVQTFRNFGFQAVAVSNPD